jgi:hypothetical protein
MPNYPLFIFDILTLPITFVRLVLIYFNGAPYDIYGLEFLDVMQHAKNKYFNQLEDDAGISTVELIDRDIRIILNKKI